MSEALPPRAGLGAGNPPMELREGPLVALYEDADLLVLDKPAGLLCVPGRGPDKQDCLSARAQRQWPSALIVHRLDQATSGLVVMARHLSAQRTLSQAFAERQVEKRYLAVVTGRLHAPPGTPAGSWQCIDLPIAADWLRRPLRVIDLVAGKPSQTRWRALSHDSAANTTRVELEPVTGRTHQLRVHLSACGHAIVGDALYAGAAPHLPDRPVPPASAQEGQRLHLHACSIALEHPRTGQRIALDSPAPF